jgi:hypothetical protein
MAASTGSMGKVGSSLSGVRNTKANPAYVVGSAIVTRTIITGMPSSGTSGPVRPSTGQLYPRGV